MEIIPTGFDIESRLAALQAENERAPDQLGREAFLELLISQLSHQDPLEPMKDQEFVAQLAQFSSLEQLESINGGIQASLLMNQSVNNSLATNLIGKEVLTAGNGFELGESGDLRFRVELGQAASTTVRILDSNGNVVHTFGEQSLKQGSNDLKWDGKNDAGDRAPEGSYTIEVEAKDISGNTVASRVDVRAVVEGVRFVQGTGFLLVNGSEIPLASIVEVLAPSGE
jgi:flagellar basal-body rod modification protein FlgD